MKKRNILIGSLLAVVVLLGVGYAAFQTTLNINGVSSVTSTWNVKITNVISKNIVGTATNNGEPIFSDLSASFATNLVSPGDSIEYDITVTNAGTIDATVDKIVMTDANNPAIKFTVMGLNQDDIIIAGHTAVMTIKVEYLSTITSQPASTTSDITATINCSQAVTK